MTGRDLLTLTKSIDEISKEIKLQNKILIEIGKKLLELMDHIEEIDSRQNISI